MTRVLNLTGRAVVLAFCLTFKGETEQPRGWDELVEGCRTVAEELAKHETERGAE
jgi:hypothetical protein